MSKLANLMIGIILFSMFMVGTSHLIDGMKDKHGLTAEEGWEEEFDFIDNMTTISEDMTSTLESEDTNWAEGGFRLGYSVLKSILKIPKFISSIFGNIAIRLGLPAWAVNYIIVIMVIILIFLLGSALVRWYL